ncbi:MAG: T9SS type A sorting domain-containing protein [Bacteroides sp.]|nr:T9SS type A sorting domain-containing protein [Roseburia sp.]MCM1347255.1 T9SS type A sorting domain-containing protein [Bacteroides sp.]MCM1421781.1 T9SS type A sorting domain-containing protein [Bacteroides sp.]
MNKNIRNAFIFSMIWLISAAMYSQANMAGIKSFGCGAGREVSIPVYLANHDEVVAVQLKLEMPFALDERQGCKLSDRSNGHSISVRKLNGTQYLFVIYSASNKPLRGTSGDLFYIPVTIPETCLAGDSYSITCLQQIISDAEGRNICNGGFEDATVTITNEPHPDLEAGDVRTSETQIVPGENIAASWSVTNVGSLNTSSGWKENVSLVSASGERCFLGTVYYEGILAAGENVLRQADFQISGLPGLGGSVSLEVEVVADNDCGELPIDEDNNIALSAKELKLAEVLTLEMPSSAIVETYSAPIACKLYRSGSWATDQTFSVSAEDDARLQTPKEVTVKAGQSGCMFYVSVKDNDILDEDSIIYITVSGNGYAQTQSAICIEDDELPRLNVEMSKNVIEEGDKFKLTVNAERAVSAPLTVYLSCDYPQRFTFPSQIVIPKGKKTASTDISAVDDNLPDMTVDATFKAIAERHESGEGFIMLNDNDVPEIELILTPQTVSESAGNAAIVGKLRRTSHKDSKVTVNLSDNASGELVYSTQTLVLESGVEENMFVIGVKDNTLVDGDRVYDVTAAVYISSCNCSASGTTAGTVSKKITVTDDDGPALSLKARKTTVLEGTTATITLTRNAFVDEALEIRLASDDDDALEYEHEILFPAGVSSIDIPVKIKKNSATDDHRTVTFTASGKDFPDGTCWMMITDNTLPDAVLQGFTLSAFNVEAKGSTNIMLTVANNGDAILPAKTKISIFFNGYLYTTLKTVGDIAPGDSEIVSESIDMPDMTGDYTMQAVVNESQSIKELFYGNNTSDQITVRLLPRFTAVVAPAKLVYSQGETVILKGKATGRAAANADVDVFIVNSGYRDVVRTKTDSTGEFTAEYLPLSGQTGHFFVGACYPNEQNTVAQAEFDIIGLKIVSGNNEYIKVEQGVEHRGSICVSNPSSIDMRNVTLSLVSAPANCSFEYDENDNIPAGKDVLFNYTLKTDAATIGNNWQRVTLRLSDGYGTETDLNVFYYCLASQPKLESGIESISVNMVKNEIREYELSISNTGKGETGPLTLAIPKAEWISADCTSYPSLAYGETATLKIKLHPTDDMPYNSTYTTRIAVAGSNGCSFVWDADFKVVSSGIGRIEFDVIDEYTYYNEDAPHVDSAAVIIKEPYSNKIVDSGMSGKDGRFLSKELPCGTYYCYIRKKQHSDASFVMTVEPSETVRKTVSLLYAPIRYSWSGEKTEIGDTYQFTLNTEFETNVPVPVVVIDFTGEVPADMTPGDTAVVMAMVTNHGLVAAENVLVRTGEHDYYTATPLTTSLGTLEANTTRVVPVVITRKAALEAKLREDPGIHCTFTPTITVFSTYRRRCNFETAEWEYYDIRGELPLPTANIHCHIVLPDLTHIPDVTDPEPWRGFPWLGEPDRPIVLRPTEPETPPLPGNDFELPDLGDLLDINSNLSLPYMEELKGCQRECVEEVGRIAFDLLTNSSSGEECAASTMGRFNACTNALQTGWRIGKWTTDCLIPFLQQRIHVLEQNRTEENRIETDEKIRMLNDDVDKLKKATEDNDDKEDEYAQEYEKVNKNFPDDSIVHKADSTDIIKDIIDHIEEETLSEESRQDILEKYKDSILSEEEILALFARLDESIAKWDTPEWNDGLINMDKFYSAVHFIQAEDKRAQDLGYADYPDLYLSYADLFTDIYFKNEPKGCTKVTMQFSQSASMTREAFKGYLSIENTNDLSAITDLSLKMSVLDKEGNDCTHLFYINPVYDTQGITLSDGKGRIEAAQTGTYTVLFIPTKNAAPETPTDYRFTGYFSYVNPYTGDVSSHTLMPITMTVSPSPSLNVDYFIQRDVFSDDPLTETIEKSVPAEMAVLVHNVGYGDAKNVSFNVQQPQIVDNEKGLAIDMRIVGSSFNGIDKSVAIGASTVTNFGTIPAMETACAQWWQESSLLGHFTEYDVEATHITSYGNDSLSLLNNVSVHELIHSVVASSATGDFITAFLVNDMADSEDMPDMLYLSDGTTESVENATVISCKSMGGNQYALTLYAPVAGWNYTALSDPTMGRMTLSAISRADGTNVDSHNFWQTDCTLRDGKKPLYENLLHLADRMDAGSVTYTLTFVPKPIQYEVRVKQENSGGTVQGAVNGMYDNGAVLTLVAVPDEGFRLGFWQVNGEVYGTEDVFTFTVEQDAEIQAIFEEEQIHTQEYALSEGWNWVSQGLRTDIDLSVFNGKAEQILQQTNGLATEPVTGLHPLEAYKVRMSEDADITMSGYALSPAKNKIDLQAGWNWIGCPIDYTRTLDDAFLYSAPEEGDVVCGQDGYAVYEDGRWCGTLTAVTSGYGYLYKSMSGKQLVYNTDWLYEYEIPVPDKQQADNPEWRADKRLYPHTMNITADVYTGEEKTSPDVYRIGAFNEDECRGVGEYVQGTLYLTVYGEGGEQITFKALDCRTGDIWNVEESELFVSDALGSPKKPYLLHVPDGRTGIAGQTAAWSITPLTATDYIHVVSGFGHTDEVRIVSLSGSLALLANDIADGASVCISHLSSGVYIVTARSRGHVYRTKIVKY